MLARNLIFVLEQPSQSLLYRHKRMEWLLNRVSYVACLNNTVKLLASLLPAQVYEVHFWQMHYGKDCPKRTMLLSNLRSAGLLDLGTLTQDQKALKHTLETTRTCGAYTFDNA